MNLLAKAGSEPGHSPGKPTWLFDMYKSTNDPSAGQLGVITSMNVNHNLESPEIGVIQKAANTILPKMIEVTIDFACIHEATLGWSEDNQFLGGNFPYNAILDSPDLDLAADATYNQKQDARRRSEAKRQVAAQDAANAEARGYNGMFGNKRMKKDIRQLDKIEARNERRAEKGKDPRARDVANYDYLQSALEGQIQTEEGATQYADNLEDVLGN